QIIHGDLTTSNVLLKDFNEISDNEEDEFAIRKRLYFIDFGLSQVSAQSEEKAVDLYVLERALLSTHSMQAKEMFENVLAGYAIEYKANLSDVMARLKQVQLRGRKRSMIG